MKSLVRALAIVTVLMVGTVARAELTATYVSWDGNGSGAVEGDAVNAVNAVTLLDADDGDMWDGGDQFQYLHTPEKMTGDWTAKVRVIAQTEALDGRWGKAGIRASNDLTGNSSNAMAQVAAGNGSQVDPPAVGDHSPIPVRLAGRTTNDGVNGFEDPVLDADGVEVPMNVFPTATAPAANMSWLSLSYTSADNGFVTGYSEDGATWSYSNKRTDIFTDGNGWYIGLAYSAHSDLDFTQVTREDGLHGVTFDNFSIVPEPAGLTILGLGLMGLLGLRRRK